MRAAALMCHSFIYVNASEVSRARRDLPVSKLACARLETLSELGDGVAYCKQSVIFAQSFPV